MARKTDIEKLEDKANITPLKSVDTINKEKNLLTENIKNISTRYKKKLKPYAKSRPSYAKGQIEKVWENAKDSLTGKVYDPTGKEIIWDRTKPRKGQWDMGHIPGEKYSEVHELYMNDVITKEEFLEWYRNLDNYRPELPSTNRGHKYE